MLDRSQRFGIVVSLGLHVLAAAAFTVVSALAPSAADSSLPPEAVIVEVRLDGPQTRVVDAAPHRSSAPDARRAENANPLPAVSAPPPKTVEAKPVAPKSRSEVSPEPVPVRERTPAPDPAEAPLLEPVASQNSATASQHDGPEPGSEGVAGASGSPSELAEAGDPQGGSNASGLPGRATGGGDEEDDPFARYIESVRTRIQARKHYPPLARKRSVEGRVVARVAIRADGRIQAVDFERGAQPLLRRATQDAIRAAAPYPAPPAGAVTIELPIDYSLRDAS